MKCPITGKPCQKHKSFSVEENGKQFLVCEDCLHAGKTSCLQDCVQKCKNCGKTLAEVIAGGKMGCAACYDNFSDSIAYVIASVQRGESSIQHVGGVPSGFLMETAKGMTPERFLAELSEEMGRAVAEEDYRRAMEVKLESERFKDLMKRANSEEIALFIFKRWGGVSPGDSSDL